MHKTDWFCFVVVSVSFIKFPIFCVYCDVACTRHLYFKFGCACIFLLVFCVLRFCFACVSID